MYLTIWRHGQAGSAASDRQRELTSVGSDDIGFGCHRFHELSLSRGIEHPDVILYSEWVRTTQTAEILAAAFSQAHRSACQALLPGRTVEDVDRELDTRFASEPPRHLLLVSHQPLVSALVGHYLGDASRAPSLVPGGMATLELEVLAPACATLLFSAQPPSYEPII